MNLIINNAPAIAKSVQKAYQRVVQESAKKGDASAAGSQTFEKMRDQIKTKMEGVINKPMSRDEAMAIL